MFVSVLASTRSSIPAMLDHAAGHARPLVEPKVETSAPPPRKLAWSVGAPLRRVLEKARVGTVGQSGTTPDPSPSPSPSPEQASVGIAALGGDVHLRLLHFAHYGKLFIKATRLHPDFFMQVRVALALTLALALAQPQRT